MRDTTSFRETSLASDIYSTTSADANLLLTFSSSLTRQVNRRPTSATTPGGESDLRPSPTRKRRRASPCYESSLCHPKHSHPLRSPPTMSCQDSLQESQLRRTLETSMRADGWLPQNERPGAHDCYQHDGFHHFASAHGYGMQGRRPDTTGIHRQAAASGSHTPTYTSPSSGSRPSSAATHRPGYYSDKYSTPDHHSGLPQTFPCRQTAQLAAMRSNCCADNEIMSACNGQPCSDSQECSPFSQDYFPLNAHCNGPAALCDSPAALCDVGCDEVSCMDQLNAAGAACREPSCELPPCTTPDCEQQPSCIDPCLDPCLDFDCLEQPCDPPQYGSACVGPVCAPRTTCNLEQICPQCPPGHHPAASGHLHQDTSAQEQHQWHCPPTVCSDTQPGGLTHCWDDCNLDLNAFQHTHNLENCQFDYEAHAPWPAMSSFHGTAHHQRHFPGTMHEQHDCSVTHHCSKKHKQDHHHACHGTNEHSGMNGHGDANDLFGNHIYDTLAAQAHGMSSHFDSTAGSLHGSDIFSNDPLTHLSNEAARRDPLPSRQKRKGVDGDVAYDEATNQHICRWQSLDNQTCLQPFSTPKDLRDHIFQAHTARGKARADSGGIVCRWNNCCRGFSATNSNSKNPHPHGHDGTHTHENCAHTFRDGVKLEVHICSHANYKKHTCPYCPDAFITKSQLDNHLKTHTGARPFVCPHFDTCTSKVKAFATKTGLSTHVRSQHQKAKPFKCKFEGCVSEFADSSNRTKHHRDVHGAEASMPCPAVGSGCEYRDTRAEGLRTHCKMCHTEDVAVVAMLGEDTRTPAWVKWLEEHKVQRRRISDGNGNGGNGQKGGKVKTAGKKKKGDAAAAAKGRGGDGGLPDLMPLVAAVNGMGGGPM